MTQTGNVIELSVDELEVLLATAQERAKPRTIPVSEALGIGLARSVNAVEHAGASIRQAWRNARSNARAIRAATVTAYRLSRLSTPRTIDAPTPVAMLERALAEARASTGTVALPADLLAKAVAILQKPSDVVQH